MAHRLSIKEVKNTLSEIKKEADQNGLSSVAYPEEKLTQEMIDTLELV